MPSTRSSSSRFATKTTVQSRPEGSERVARARTRDPFQRARHARYFEPDTAYHVVFRTSHGLWLLRPDREGRLAKTIAGVFGRAKVTFPGVHLHAATFLSNHAHLVISGDSNQLAAYVGFVKREVSRRWGPVIGWRGVFAQSYIATAVISRAAQLRCLKYVLAQAVAADIVDHPAEWPGFQCAAALVSGRPVEGEWLDGTAYGKALFRESSRGRGDRVRGGDFIVRSDAVFSPLPTMSGWAPEAYRDEMARLVDKVVAEGRAARASEGRTLCGIAAVYAAQLTARTDLPRPPWFEQRRRMVVWDDRRDVRVREYLARYWAFQESFRASSDEWLKGCGDVAVRFPPGAYRPGIPRPVAYEPSRAA